METSVWVDKQLISVDQARGICGHYGVDYDAIGSRSTGYRMVVNLGFLFVGIALITVIGGNWDEIPRGVRMAGLLLLTAGTHGLAIRKYLSDDASSAAGLFFLGTLFYGASIVLIAQIYHLGEHMPDGVFLWALGSLPVAVLLGSAWLTVFNGLLALLWFFLEFRTGFLAPKFLLAAFPLFLAVQLYMLARARVSVPLFLVFVIGLVLWIEALFALLWMDDAGRLVLSAEHVFISVALFILAHAASHWLNAQEAGKAKDYGAVLSLWALRFALLSMLGLSFAEPWRGLLRADWDQQTSMWVAVAAIMALALAIGSKTGKAPGVLALAVLCGGSMIAVVATQDAEAVAYFQVLDSVALIAAGIGLIFRGTSSGVSHYYFLGVATILLTAFLRYADLIGDYLDSAMLFAGLAVLLLVSARYWRDRRRREVLR